MISFSRRLSREIMADSITIQSLQDTIEASPYSIPARLALAKAYQAHQYPDLAAGEAYLALLLVDECLGATGEFEAEALEAALAAYEVEDEDKVLEVVRGERSGM